jgi:amino-acid N-acetyltransferase
MALSVDLRPALPSDLETVRELLQGAELPTAGVDDQFPAAYTVAMADGSIVGVAGLERHENAGLLRSLAVRPGFRGTGIGRELVRERTEHARARGLGSVFLLTTSATEYFENLGFRQTPRAAAPAELAKSKEFESICPETAACLVWHP